jgi:UDP-4-amino-4-deoxy-L-arabinose-oxoglutarate aminotransferase
MDTGIQHSKPWITAEDSEAVLNALASAMIGQGAKCRMLERRLANWVGASDGVAVGCGAASLVLALHGVGIEPGDEVILPTYVCRSVLESVLAAYGTPVLCDVGADWVMTVDSAMLQMTRRTKAVIVPHMYGIFCDVAAFRPLNVHIIEDCAQAVAGESQREIQGDVAMFSLHPTKCLSSGEGGVVVSKDMRIVERMRVFRDGSANSFTPRLFSPMSDIAASLALAQLDRYPQMLARRQSLAERYRAIFEKIRPSLLNRQALGRSMFFRFPVLAEGGLESYQADFLKRGVHVRRGVDLLLHRLTGLNDDRFPVAVGLFNTTISLPIYPALTEHEESQCMKSVMDIFSHGD